MIIKSAIIEKFGKADVLQIKQRNEDFAPAPTQVLIEVHFSGINFADIMMRKGMYKDAPKRPFTPGYEVSGIVLAVGSQITHVQVGDKVMAGTRFNGYSSHLLLEAFQVHLLPESFTLEMGAGFLVPAITAHIALHEFRRVRQGDKILIDCATGGVGVMMMQMAREIGAEIHGLTTSENKKEFIQSFGAKAYTWEEFLHSQENDFDFILNSHGGTSISKLYKRLGKAGLITCIGLQSGMGFFGGYLKTILQTPFYSMLGLMIKSKMVSGFNALDFFDDEKWMSQLSASIKNIHATPHIGKIFSYQDAPKAHEYLESKKAMGKVLISWK